MDLKLKKVVNATLALMMTSTSVYAGTASAPSARGPGNLILAQAECDPATDSNCAVPPSEAPAEEPQRRARPAEQTAPQPEAEPAPRQAEPEAPAEEPAPRRQRREQPAAEPATPSAEEPAAEPAPRRQRREQPTAEPEAPAVEQQPATEEPTQPRRQRRERPAQEQQPEAPAPETPTPAGENPEQQPEAPAAEQPQAPATEQPAQRPRRERPNAPAEQAPAEQPSQEAPAQQPAIPSAEQPTGEQPAGQPTDSQAPAPANEQPAPAEAAPNDGANAPLFDSQKRPPRRQGQAPAPAEGGQAPAPGTEQTAQPPAQPAGPPPADDRAAQEAAQPVEIVPVTREKGTRREGGRADQRPRFERPQGADVVRELGDRIILQFNNQTFVESNEAPRMSRGARDVYYEDLPRGRTRETIIRENGVQVVTIRNQYGDVVRRSRITPDGREYVLTYVEDEDFERGGRAWRDPGDDLPPMNVDIDYDDYIFEAERARDVDDYYDFLREPPVERVQRLYSVDEVKRSARVRDIARRIDLDTIKFAFGKAEVPESEITRLEGVAQAMERLLKANPAETFLIEGHTDAVGTDVANLALSDRRAEAVADALTNVFGIPPENLSTQGYGEQFLKVRTQEPNQENRRVAIRRITPLVAPVASAN